MTEPGAITALLHWRGPARIDRLPAIVDALQGAVETAGADAQSREDLRLAVEEACVNVMRHAYAGAREAGWLELRVDRADWEGRDALRVELRDGGTPFDPLALPRPALDASAEEREIGGLGVHLIRSVTDAQQYRRDPDGGNCLVLFKRLASAEPPSQVQKE